MWSVFNERPRHWAKWLMMPVIALAGLAAVGFPLLGNSWARPTANPVNHLYQVVTTDYAESDLAAVCVFAEFIYGTILPELKEGFPQDKSHFQKLPASSGSAWTRYTYADQGVKGVVLLEDSYAYFESATIEPFRLPEAFRSRVGIVSSLIVDKAHSNSNPLTVGCDAYMIDFRFSGNSLQSVSMTKTIIK